jgi:Ser/Thr protein kinase RdoA (MazF antagonist)
MQELDIPDTLIHNDINSGNILFDGSRCVFIDWAEAFVGNPFLTFQQLYVQATKGSEEPQIEPHRLAKLYKRQWLDRLSEAKIDRALALAPLLAIASYLYGRGAWLHSPGPSTPTFESFARSLARHIDRAAQAQQLMEVLCR